jgi:hypothetical protein
LWSIKAEAQALLIRGFRLTRLFHLRPLVLTGLLAVIGACNGDNRPALNPANADALAHAGLPSLRDLPGTGWSVLQYDQLDPPAFWDTPACQAAKETERELEKQFGSDRLGFAEEEFIRERNVTETVTLDYRVSVYRQVGQPAAYLRERRSYAMDPQFLECAAYALDPDTTLVSASAKVPKGGYVLAYQERSGRSPFRTESYTWQYSNALVNLYIYGTPDGVRSLDAQTAIDSFQAKLRSIAGTKQEIVGSPPTPHARTRP